MLMGAIIGDHVGSIYERHNTTRTDFELVTQHCRFTDDTVLTIATADAWMGDKDYAAAYHRWAQAWPRAGFGPGFNAWVGRGPGAPPYNSWGNGAAMRVSPIAWVLDDLESVLEEARRSAAVTHDHPLGIQGAQTLAGAIFLLRNGADEARIRALVEDRMGLSLSRDLSSWKQQRRFSTEACRTVPVAFAAFFAAHDFETTLRLAISAGGDSDTIAAMAGSLAEARWGISAELKTQVLEVLPPEMIAVLKRFPARPPDAASDAAGVEKD